MLALETTPAAEARLTSDDAAAVAQRRERLRLVVGDIVALPARQREALVGHIMHGTSHAELALSLDTSVPATKTLINRARTTLIRSERARSLDDRPRQLAA